MQRSLAIQRGAEVFPDSRTVCDLWQTWDSKVYIALGLWSGLSTLDMQRWGAALNLIKEAKYTYCPVTSFVGKQR